MAAIEKKLGAYEIECFEAGKIVATTVDKFIKIHRLFRSKCDWWYIENYNHVTREAVFTPYLWGVGSVGVCIPLRMEKYEALDELIELFRSNGFIVKLRCARSVKYPRTIASPDFQRFTTPASPLFKEIEKGIPTVLGKDVIFIIASYTGEAYVA